MTISKTLDGDKLIIALEGRLDTLTAPDLEKEVSGSLANVNELVFDFEKVDYISSAGLRVLLAIQQKMDGKPVKLIKANEVVREVFDVHIPEALQDGGLTSLHVKLRSPLGVSRIQHAAAHDGVAAQHGGLFDNDHARAVLQRCHSGSHTGSAASPKNC